MSFMNKGRVLIRTPVNLLFFRDKVLELLQSLAAFALVFNNRAVET